MAKTASGILLGLGLLSLAALFAAQQQAHAAPGSGCKRWEVKEFERPELPTLPEGWEPFATSVGHGGVGWGGAVARHCIKE